ncbi:NADPH-dependent FMN reductase [Novilysobacter erysipheiresistens]|uniref:NADPH-dependent FMN reductase n=1 Tax=Novilysobacter erysipheiresistens TaxID=1749332 RepID=A0ABU7YXJ6_9GAMM
MTRILGISGSLRAGSFNTALLRAAQSLSGPDVQFDAATLHGIPLYDGDAEQRDGLPTAVVDLKDRIVASDGVLLCTPEYNNGIPGVFKNAIDWLSRPADDIPRVFGDRPFAVIGASPGGFGTILAQNAWLPVLRTLRVRYWAGGRLQVSRAHQLIDADGELTDETTRKQLETFVQGFVEFARPSS